MELVNDFTVQVPVEEAWATLTDVERIAPCLPGAQLQEIEGDVYRGVVKVKVGPILAQFKGQASFVEKDDVGHKAVLKAEGRDTAGKGNASALITALLEPQDGAATKVTVTTDLTITGKVAQFGRGALADVSTKLLGQFVSCLESTVLSSATATGTATPPAPEADPPGVRLSVRPAEAAAPASAAAPTNGGTVRQVEHATSAPVDLVDVAGGALLKRVLPLVIAGTLVLVVVLRRRRRA